MAVVQVLVGTQSSERTKKLDCLLHEHWGHALLLTPTEQLARKRQEELLLRADVPGAWGRPVKTLQSFAEDILQKHDPAVVRLSDVERRLMLEGALSRLRKAGKFEDAGPASETEGFLLHLLRVIENLKQAAVEPDEFTKRVRDRKHPTSLDTAVASAYKAYQDALIEHHAYDRIGIYWQVRRILEEERDIKGLADVELLAFDGFDDFTESEFNLIAALGKKVPRLVFSVGVDPASEASDLYALQGQTLTRLEKVFGTAPECLESSEPTTFSEYASRYLLWRGETPSRDGLEANIEVVPCAGVTEEAEAIGRAVMTLILEGVPPAEIAIVYPNMDEVRSTLRSMAREFQIPLRLYGDEKLVTSSVVAFLLDVLEASSTWRHGEVVELLISPWMDTDGVDEIVSGALPMVCRLAGIVAGHAQWAQRLHWLRRDFEREVGESEYETARYKRRNPRAIEAVEAAIARVKRLSDALAALPAKARVRAFSRAVGEFIKAMDLAEAVRACSCEEVRARETAALETLQNMLGRLNDALYGSDQELSLPEFARFLRQACGLQEFRVVPTPREREGVRCLAMASLRGLQFRHVFFGGVNEGVTPSVAGVNAVYSEEDVRELRDAGIPLELQEVRSERELAWFHHVIEAPKDRISIFWRTATPDGKPLLRSPFLNDLLRLFSHERLERPPLRASQYYPSLSEAASARDALNNIFATRAKLPRHLADEFAYVARGADIEKRRYSSAAFDAFDGVLARKENKEDIARKYNEGHVFSATELEEYQQCPFRFFALRVLRLMEVERPDTAFDRRDLGFVVHRVLEEFHRRYEGLPVADIPVSETVTAMRELVESVFNERTGRMTTL
ncbi:MAG: PD-(D/E)XK nuclease family protein, partial [Candidatus Hydrogenedentes bacterium]|nr:PD-(D/E)XK nuclease family protein [Candidatus Hydrogenedentota bacterium]